MPTNSHYLLSSSCTTFFELYLLMEKHKVKYKNKIVSITNTHTQAQTKVEQNIPNLVANKKSNKTPPVKVKHCSFKRFRKKQTSDQCEKNQFKKEAVK